MKRLYRLAAIAVSVSLIGQSVFAREALVEAPSVEEAAVASTTPETTVSEPEMVVGEETATSSPEESGPEEMAPEEPVEEAAVGPVLIAGVDYVPGEVVVKFKDDDTITVVETSKNPEIEAARLEESPRVEYAEPNYLYRFESINTDDTSRAELWALENTGQAVNGTTGTADADMDAPEAWELSRGAGVIVAVIDTGVDYTHPDLANNMWDGTSCVDANGDALGNCIHGYNFSANFNGDNARDPAPDHEHGTHVAGTIAARINNGQGTIGVAPEARIMALRTDFVLGGGTVLSSDAIVEAIDFARENGAKVINASFGGSDNSIAMHDAIERFGDAGGVFVAAAGNTTTNIELTPTYPASYNLANIITVAATTQSDAIAWFSNYGTTSVDIVAPGVNIFSTVPDNTYAYRNGTSMAAPHITGLAASLFAHDPTLSVADLKSAILTSGDSIASLASTTVTGKRANAYAALTSLGGPTTSALEVRLSIVNDSGRTATASDVTFAVDGGSSQVFEVDGTNDLTVQPGRYYSVTASSLADYTLSATGCSDVVLAAGATSTCAVIYNDNAVVSSGGGGGHGGGGSSKKKKKTAEKTTKKTSKKTTKEAVKKDVIKPPSTNAPVSPDMPRVVSTPQAAPTYQFILDRAVGSQGADVTELQKVLAAKGYLVATPTGYFGPMTMAALKTFQAANGIVPASGYLGPLTRAKLNALSTIP